MSLKFKGKKLHVDDYWVEDFGTLCPPSDPAADAKRDLIERCHSVITRRLHGKSEATATDIKNAFSKLFRCIDLHNATSLGTGTAVFSERGSLTWPAIEAMWPHLTLFLRSTEGSDHYKYRILSILSSILKAAFIDAQRGNTDGPFQELLVGSTFRRKQGFSYDQDETTIEDAAYMFKVLGRIWKRILQKISSHRHLRDGGQDPRVGRSGANRVRGAFWPVLENRMWIIRNIYPYTDPSAAPRKHISKCLNIYETESSFPIEEIDSLKSTAITRYLRHIRLTRVEILIALALVSMKTGFNIDAIARMRLSNWSTNSLIQNERNVVVQAVKRGKQYLQRASSSRTKLLDPYQIISKVIEIQQPLRDHLRDQGVAKKSDIDLDRSQLVWIYQNAYGDITDLMSETSGDPQFFAGNQILSHLIRQASSKRSEEALDGEIPAFKFERCRDIWALFVYRKSNFSLILTAKALGHRTITSLLAYIEKRSLLIEEQKKLIDIQGRVLSDLKQGMFDATTLRAKLMGEDEMSSKGLRCTDPTHPDPGGDPQHEPDTLCRRQNCLRCTKWVADLRSLPALLRIKMDLEELRDALTGAAWHTSTFSIDYELVLHIISKFSPRVVSAAEEQALQLNSIVSISHIGLGI